MSSSLLDINKPMDGDLAKFNGELWVYVAGLKKWLRLSEAGKMIWDAS